MAFSVKHAFQSLKADGGDASFVQPSKWNQEHVLLFSTNNVVLGRTSAGAGAAEEIPISSFSVPPGVVMPYAAAGSAPSGYLFCNGAAVSRTIYAALFGLFGTVYGAGDGSTTFNLPDLRGTVIAGMDTIGGVGPRNILQSYMSSSTLGAIGGVQTQTALLNGAGAATTVSGGISGVANGTYQSTQAYAGTNIFASGGGGVATGYDHVHDVIVLNAAVTGSFAGSGTLSGSTQGFATLQPTMVMNYIVKT